MPAIPSGFETDRVFRLHKAGPNPLSWTLEAASAGGSFRKEYDTGKLDDWIEQYEEEVPRSAIHFVIAENPGPVGLLTWATVEWNETIRLIDIRVAPEARRQGVGSALVLHLLGEAGRLRARGISVETQINNFPAIQFYKRNGFSIVGFNERLYSNRDLEDQDVALFLFRERNGHR